MDVFVPKFSNRVRCPDNSVRTDGRIDKIFILKPMGLNSASIHILFMHILCANSSKLADTHTDKQTNILIILIYKTRNFGPSFNPYGALPVDRTPMEFTRHLQLGNSRSSIVGHKGAIPVRTQWCFTKIIILVIFQFSKWWRSGNSEKINFIKAASITLIFFGIIGLKLF